MSIEITAEMVDYTPDHILKLYGVTREEDNEAKRISNEAMELFYENKQDEFDKLIDTIPEHVEIMQVDLFNRHLGNDYFPVDVPKEVIEYFKHEEYA